MTSDRKLFMFLQDHPTLLGSTVGKGLLDKCMNLPEISLSSQAFNYSYYFPSQGAAEFELPLKRFSCGTFRDLIDLSLVRTGDLSDSWSPGSMHNHCSIPHISYPHPRKEHLRRWPCIGICAACLINPCLLCLPALLLTRVSNSYNLSLSQSS